MPAKTAHLEVRKIQQRQQGDLLNLRLQETVPYQGLALPAEIERALAALAASPYATGGIPRFPSIFCGDNRPRLQKALRAFHQLSLPIGNPAEGARAFRAIEPHIKELLAFSMPSLIPTLAYLVKVIFPGDDLDVALLALKWLGDSAHYFKEYGVAFRAYTRLLAESERTGNQPLRAHAHRGLGDCAIKRGAYQEALELYRSSCRIYERIGQDESLPRTYRSVADAQRALGQDGPAIRKYAEAGHLAKAAGQTWNYSKTFQERGWTEWKRGAQSAAIDCFLQALEEHQKLQRSRGRFTCQYALARLYAFQPLEPAALRCSREEMTVAVLLGHRPWKERVVLMGLGW